MRFLIDITPLRSSDAFRRIWIGMSASFLGRHLSLVAILAQVWDLTRNSVAVGAAGLVRAVPAVAFGLLGGALADSVDRRKLVLRTSTASFLIALMLAWQAIASVRSYVLILVLIGLQAAVEALGSSARRTFIARLLPKELVAAGLALLPVSFHTSMLLGPALGGLIIAQWGVGFCFLIEAALYSFGFYGVFRLRSMRPEGGPRWPSLHTVGEGLRFSTRTGVIRGALLTDIFATVLAMPVSLFPAINDERFGGNPRTLGLCLSAIAVGGIAASAMSGTFTRARRPGVVMLVAATVWGVALAGFGLAGPLWLALGCLTVAGCADTISVVSRGTIIQLATPDSHRGRVSSVENIVGQSGPDIGNFRGGLVAGPTSPELAVVSGGLLCVLTIALVAWRNRPLRRFALSTDSPISIG